MKFHCCAETDSLYIDLADRPGAEAREVAPGVVLDFDAADRLVGIDIDHTCRMCLEECEASPRVTKPIDGLVDGGLIDPALPRVTPCLVGQRLPFPLRPLVKLPLEHGAVRFGQRVDSLENLGDHLLAHLLNSTAGGRSSVGSLSYARQARPPTPRPV